jgi:DNA-binding phage protein
MSDNHIGLDRETRENYETVRSQAGHGERGGHNGFMRLLLDAYTNRREVVVAPLEQVVAMAGLTSEEREGLYKALENKTNSLTAIVHDGIVSWTKRLNTAQEKLASADVVGNRDLKIRGSAPLRIGAVVTAMIAENVHANASDRRYLSMNEIASRSGLNRQHIAEWLRENAALVNAHHQAMGWYTAGDGLKHNHAMVMLKKSQEREAQKVG